MSNQIKGILHLKHDTVQVGEKFSKREFVIRTTEDMYQQYLSLQLTNDKCGLLDGIELGSDVVVSYNLRGREWTNPQGEVKYFNTIEAWRVEKVGSNEPKEYTAPPINNSIPTPSEEDDDLPL